MEGQHLKGWKVEISGLNGLPGTRALLRRVRSGLRGADPGTDEIEGVMLGQVWSPHLRGGVVQ